MRYHYTNRKFFDREAYHERKKRIQLEIEKSINMASGIPPRNIENRHIEYHEDLAESTKSEVKTPKGGEDIKEYEGYKVGDFVTVSDGKDVFYNAVIVSIKYNWDLLVCMRFATNNYEFPLFGYEFINQMNRVKHHSGQWVKESNKPEPISGVDIPYYNPDDIVPCITAYGYKVPLDKSSKSSKSSKSNKRIRGTSDTGPK